MVQGQLVFKARIDYVLWEKILDLATNDANDGYAGLLEYLEEPVNCYCELIEGTKWCEIQLGADSYRDSEWIAIHRIISCVLWYAFTADVSALSYYEIEGPVNMSRIKPEPFESTKDFASWFKENQGNLTFEQATNALFLFMPLKSN